MDIFENGYKLSFGRRLKVAIGTHSARAFAQKCGISETVFRAYLADKSDPSRKALITMAEAAEVSLEWLALGRGEARLSSVKDLTEDPLCGEEKSKLAVIQPAIVKKDRHSLEEFSDSVSFSSNWLKENLDLKASDLALVVVNDESMQPLLSPNDIVLVNLKMGNRQSHDGIYVLLIEDMITIRRCQRLPGNKIKAMCNNPSYESFVFNANHALDGVEVLGPVVWFGHNV